MRRQLLGEQVVLFRDSKGGAHAMGAVCPHRGMDLSCGRVVGDNLQCPWHGWEYGGDGRCVKIPAQAANVAIPSRARVAKYHLQEQQGILWIWLDQNVAPEGPPRRYDFFDIPNAYREYWKPAYGTGGWINTIENTLNTAHLAFVHTKSMGVKMNPLVGASVVAFDEDGSGFKAWEPPPVKPVDYNSQRDIITSGAMKWFAPLIGIKKVAERRTSFNLGGFTYVTISYVDGSKEWVLAATTPGSDTHTWFFFETVRTRGRHALANWFQRRFMRLLLEEDIDIVSKVMANGPMGLPNPVSAASDARMLAFRRVYARALRAEGKPVPWTIGAQSPGETEGLPNASMPTASAAE